MDVLDSGESLSIFTLSPANAVLRSRVRHAALPTSSSARRRVARWVPSRDLSQGSSTRLKRKRMVWAVLVGGVFL